MPKSAGPADRHWNSAGRGETVQRFSGHLLAGKGQRARAAHPLFFLPACKQPERPSCRHRTGTQPWQRLARVLPPAAPCTTPRRNPRSSLYCKRSCTSSAQPQRQAILPLLQRMQHHLHSGHGRQGRHQAKALKAGGAAAHAVCRVMGQSGAILHGAVEGQRRPRATERHATPACWQLAHHVAACAGRAGSPTSGST